MQPNEEQVRRRLVGQWIHKADQDLRAARSLLADDPSLLYPSCFHSQQAAEKYLKALLVYKQVEFPKTKDIQRVLDLVETFNPTLANSLQSAVVLTEYGLDTCCPGDLSEPDPDETKTALALAEKVRDAVMPGLPST